MRTYRIDMIPGKVGAVINASQYDYGYEVQVTLYEGSVTYQIPSGASIRVEGTKSDAKGFSYECRVANGIVYVPIQIQMTAVQGDVPCELVVYKDGLRVGSCNFILAVEESALDGDTDISETDIPAIIAEATEQMEAAASSASQAAASATQAASSAASAETAKTAAMDAAQDAIDAAQELQTAIQFNAALIHETASGAVASFADGADDIPMQSVVAEITPVQDLNGYSNPWPGGGGKNIAQINNIDIPALVGSQRTVDISSPVALSAGTYTLSWTFTGNVTQTRNQPLYAIDNVQTYSNKNCSTSGRYSWTFTLASDATLTFRWWANDLSAACSATDFMLEKGSTATAYAPYSNICPISGRTGMTVTRAGRNLCPSKTISMGGTNERTVTINLPYTLPAGEYIMSYTVGGTGTGGWGLNFYYDSTRVGVLDTGTGRVTMSAPANKIYTYMAQVDYNAGYTRIIDNIQLELGTVVTAYTPYVAPSVYPITWETEAGTVYGGTLDVVGGVLTVDRMYAEFAASGEGKYLLYTNTAYNRLYVYSSFVLGALITPNNAADISNAICNMLPPTSRTIAGGTSPVPGVFQYHQGSQNELRFGFPREEAYDSVDKIYALGLSVVIPLKEPTTYQLTPTEVRTLLGGNTIYTDAGSVTVEYIADTKLYIDNKIAELQALILEN